MRRTTGLRYREDTGFELCCGECRTYWPLDLEFWSKVGFSRCKACWAAYKRRSQRENYRRPEVRAKRHAYQVAYRKDASYAKRLYQQEKYWADPEKHRAKARERYYRNREEILAKKKAKYAADGPRWTPEKRKAQGERTKAMLDAMTPEQNAAWRRAISEARRRQARAA